MDKVVADRDGILIEKKELIIAVSSSLGHLWRFVSDVVIDLGSYSTYGEEAWTRCKTCCQVSRYDYHRLVLHNDLACARNWTRLVFEIYTEVWGHTGM